jgi:hypothetical protein
MLPAPPPTIGDTVTHLSELYPGDIVRLFGCPDYDEVYVTVRSVVEHEKRGTLVHSTRRFPYFAEDGWEAEVMSADAVLPIALFITYIGADGIRKVACRELDSQLWMWGGMPVPGKHLREYVGDSEVINLIPDTGA